MDTTLINEEAFIIDCENGHLPIAQWFYSLGTNIHVYNECAFILSCINGHLHIAQWLYSLGTNIHIINEYAFIKSCEYGHLHIAQWLYSLGANIHVDNNIVFKSSCMAGRLEIAQWLCSICSDYNINIVDNKINYTIVEWYNKMNTTDIIKKLKINAAASITVSIDICLICYNKGNLKLQCGHFLCADCMIEWYVKNENALKCVYCAAPLEYKKMIFYSAVVK